jgi:DNA gyrase subunit A
MREIYETGQGAVRLRGEWKPEEGKRGAQFMVITSIPYALEKAKLIEQIADVVRERKLPHLLDVRDESTNDVRIVLEIKRESDPNLVMSYLYKHTALQQNFNVNMTCLVPTDNVEVGAPQRLDLKSILQHFIDFRMLTVRRRFEHDLDELRKRIHILEALERIFDALDEAIKIIRKSDGKADAAGKLMKRFDLDDLQADAVLELKLYKLAKLEIEEIRAELAEKTKEAKRIEGILKDKKKLTAVVRDELREVRDAHGTERRSRIGGAGGEVEYSEEAYIIAEDANVVVTRDGWVKRVRELKDPTQTRTREGDEVAAVLSGSTKENIVFFTNFGGAFVTKINDIPPSTGYGDPVQKLFKFKDGERVVSALSLDPRAGKPEILLAVSRKGFGLRFALEPHKQESTRAGRKFARPAQGDELVGVAPAEEKDVVCVATEKGHVLLCAAGEVNLLANPGKGVTVIKVTGDDRVIGFGLAKGKAETPLVLETGTGKQIPVGPKSYEVTSRGGKGREVVKRSTLKVVPQPVKVTTFTSTEVN